MSRNNNSNSGDNTEEQNTNEKECFVIMPISDRPPYGEGHFRIVYEHLIKPACVKAGFIPIRADEVKETNFIVKDILKRILNSDMAICDLSGQNPNVLFELGIRQSFNLPVTIIKDITTPRIFDIDGLRCVDYDENLRVDNINSCVNVITEMIKNTYESRENSLIESLSITPAQVPQERVLSNDTSILLEAIKDINEQLTSLRYSSRVPTIFTENKTPTSEILTKLIASCCVGSPKEIENFLISRGTRWENQKEYTDFNKISNDEEA